MKETFQMKYDEIEVPKEDVRNAIRSGIERADSHPVRKKRLTPLKKYAMPSAAALLLISSSFLVPSFSKALASAPIVGQLYSNFNELVQRDLASEHLITKLDETASDKGIDVTVESVFYDSGLIGAKVHVKGDVEKNESGKLTGFYKIFGGDDNVSDSKELVHMKPAGDGFTGLIQFAYPAATLPADTTFPLEFITIGDQKGDWKFDVPIKQLPNDRLEIDQITEKEHRSVHFTSVLFGEATTAINYTASFPADSKHDQVRLEIVDDKGNRIETMMDGIGLEKTKKSGTINSKERSIIPQELVGKTKFIIIYPKVAITGKDPNQPLELDPVKIIIK